jgi:hypothetical protein
MGRLVGFVNVAWDGGVHAFVLDMMVVATHRRQGVGARLVAVAEARAAGCEWLHADFDDEHKAFYFDACGFRTPPAGVIKFTRQPAAPRVATLGAPSRFPGVIGAPTPYADVGASDGFDHGTQQVTFVVESDLRGIVSLLIEMWHDHWGFIERPFDQTLDDWREGTENEGVRFYPTLWFLAVDGDEIVGISLCNSHIADDTTCGCVQGLGVSPA